MDEKQRLQRLVNDTHSDLNNLELGISALVRQGFINDARGLMTAKNIMRTRLRDAREELEAAK